MVLAGVHVLNRTTPVHAERQLQQFGGGAGHAGGVNGASYVHQDHDHNNWQDNNGNNGHQGGDRKLLDSGGSNRLLSTLT